MRWAARVLAGAGPAASATAFVACASVLNIDSNRHVTESVDPDAAEVAGADAGAAPVADWSCLANPSAELDPNKQVDVTVLVMDGTQMSESAGAIDGGSDLDTVSGAWLEGVTVSDCGLRDLDCASNSVTQAVTDSLGRANFQLPEDFTGFFGLQRADLVPATLYPGRFLKGASPVSYPAYAVSPSGLGVLAGSIMADAGLDQTGTVGHVLVTIYDCQDHQASGVSVHFSTIGPDTVPFYFFMGLPTRDGVETDDFGLAGAVNIPVGPQSVTAELPASGAQAPLQVGMATFSVRAGAISQAWIRARTH